MVFDHLEYNKTKIECTICPGKTYARGNSQNHKGTKRHQRNLNALLDTLTPNEREKMKVIIEKVNHEDLKRIL